MTYHLSRQLAMPFDQALAHVTDALKAEGFGVLTEIDIKDTLKKKLDVDVARYHILGACNPGARLQGPSGRTPYRHHAALQRHRPRNRWRRR